MFYLFLIIETLSIYFYMKGGIMGPALFMLNFLIVIFNRKTKLYKTLALLIMSLPFSFIGIAGIDMIHILSWYNAFLVLFIFFNFSNLRISGPAGMGALIIFVCLVIATLWAFDAGKAWIEIAQIMVMLLPTVVVFCSRKLFKINSIEINQLIAFYGHIAFCTAIGMLIQYYYIVFQGTQIGLINFSGGGRISCYALFRGASILPIFMGSGLLALFMQNYKRISLLNIVEMIILFSAIVLNSSRTGLFGLFLVIGYEMLARLRAKMTVKSLFLMLMLIAIGIIGLEVLMSNRQGLESFTEENGREVTYINGIDIWLDSPRNFLFGEGFTGGMWEGITKTHNFVIQTLAQNGIIVASLIFTFVLLFLRYTQKTPFKYIVWFIVITGMLVTDFYANAFTSVAFILVSLHSQHPEYSETVKYRQIL